LTTNTSFVIHAFASAISVVVFLLIGLLSIKKQKSKKKQQFRTVSPRTDAADTITWLKQINFDSSPNN